ncbi:unnamed protein product, partial [marine sediment metagenome]
WSFLGITSINPIITFHINQLLIEAGAYVNTRNNHGHTALKFALRRRHKDIVKLLEEAGARE